MKTIRINLNNGRSILSAINEIRNYREDLKRKCERFVKELAEVGIKTGEANTGEYGKLIVFKKEVNPTATGCKGVMYATSSPLKVVWGKNGERSAEISPLLMAEFGSGWEAKVLDNVSGVGQGTFPGQTHAFDPDGWWWTDTEGNTHHSMGQRPTFPVHSAMLAMRFEMERIAREVFDG